MAPADPVDARFVIGAPTAPTRACSPAAGAGRAIRGGWDGPSGGSGAPGGLCGGLRDGPCAAPRAPCGRRAGAVRAACGRRAGGVRAPCGPSSTWEDPSRTAAAVQW